MSVPENVVEQAIMYARFDSSGAIVGSDLQIDQKKAEYEKLISSVDPTKLVGLLVRLEDDSQLYTASSDESIARVYSHFGLPIEGHEDLDLFKLCLADRVREAASSDAAVKRQADHYLYQIALRDAPLTLAKFNATKEDFYALAEPMDAVARYVLNAVQNDDFSINADDLIIHAYKKRACVQTNTDRSSYLNTLIFIGMRKDSPSFFLSTFGGNNHLGSYARPGLLALPSRYYDSHKFLEVLLIYALHGGKMGHVKNFLGKYFKIPETIEEHRKKKTQGLQEIIALATKK